MDNEILQRYIEGNATDDEMQTVVEWLDADEANVREFTALHKLFDITVFNKLEFNREEASSKNVSKKRYRKISYECIKVAAIIAICWMGFRFLFTDEKPAPSFTETYQTLYIPAGQRAELLLPDSTKVWLNARTKLIYPTHFGEKERKVILDGEAYFDVRRKKGQPFIVRTEKMDIEVSGTEFNVSSYSRSSVFRVALLEGSVNLNARDISGTYTMKVNEQVSVENSKLCVTKINDYDYFKWKEGILCFNNETVASIMEKLQLYYDVEIVINKRDFLSDRYTGKFRISDGITQVLKVLQLEHQFTYTRDNKLNIITIQ